VKPFIYVSQENDGQTGRLFGKDSKKSFHLPFPFHRPEAEVNDKYAYGRVSHDDICIDRSARFEIAEADVMELHFTDGEAT